MAVVNNDRPVSTKSESILLSEIHKSQSTKIHVLKWLEWLGQGASGFKIPPRPCCESHLMFLAQLLSHSITCLTKLLRGLKAVEEKPYMLPELLERRPGLKM